MKALRYVVNFDELDRSCQGQIANAIAAQTKPVESEFASSMSSRRLLVRRRSGNLPPRRIVMNLGKRAVRSHPADIVFAATFTPIWATKKPSEMMATPARVALDAELPSAEGRRKRSMISWGLQTNSPKMTSDEEPMRMPKSDTIEKQTGRASKFGRTTSDGRRARDAKSVAMVRRVSLVSIAE